MRGENRSTRGKPSYGRVQQTQSTYDTECGKRTRATLVEGKCSQHYANPATIYNNNNNNNNNNNIAMMMTAFPLGTLGILDELCNKSR